MLDLLINSNDFNSGAVITANTLLKIINVIKDKDYLDFIKETNGGFFYNYSLQFYAVETPLKYHNIFLINQYIHEAYGKFLGKELFFAQDVFGNQFGFSDMGIIFFNMETGERQVIAEGFNKWIDVLNRDLDYFTGRKLVEDWNMSNTAIKPNERFHPKKPFVIGGEF